jgi:hypothetical protein
MPNRKDQLTTEKPLGDIDFVPMPSTSSTNLGQAAPAFERNRGSELLDQAKTAAGEAYESVAEKATSSLEEKKASLSGGLNTIADSVRRAGDSLAETQESNYLTEYSARYAKTAAQKLQQAARYFETSDLSTMRRDAENFARRNPAVFLGGAFLLGMLAARFLKSGSNGSTTQNRGRSGTREFSDTHSSAAVPERMG